MSGYNDGDMSDECGGRGRDEDMSEEEINLFLMNAIEVDLTHVMIRNKKILKILRNNQGYVDALVASAQNSEYVEINPMDLLLALGIKITNPKSNQKREKQQIETGSNVDFGNQVDGKDLSASDKLFQEYLADRFDQDQWLKENGLSFD